MRGADFPKFWGPAGLKTGFKALRSYLGYGPEDAALFLERSQANNWGQMEQSEELLGHRMEEIIRLPWTCL